MKYPLQSRGLFGRKYLDLQERVREIEAPDGEHALVKVRACGVCGTDVNFVRDWQDDPQALGHEIAGEVLKVGRNVHGFQAGVDREIVSSPPESLYDAFKVIRFGGIITFFGLHFGGKSKVSVDVNDLVFRKVSLIPTFAEPAINFPAANRLLAEGLVDAAALVTHTFGFDQAADTLRGIVDGTLPVIKAVMLPHG
jgi:threonine dehydrogenase-like Zn-dependent dehydrogenase